VSSGTFEEEGADGLIRRDHISRLHKAGVELWTSDLRKSICEPESRSEVRGLRSNLLFS
jgi:hypothetical protein